MPSLFFLWCSFLNDNWCMLSHGCSWVPALSWVVKLSAKTVFRKPPLDSSVSLVWYSATQQADVFADIKWFRAIRITGICVCVPGNLNESAQHLSVDSVMSLSSPMSHSGQRFSSDSSCRSIMTDDSEDGAFMSPVFDDSSPFSPTEPNSCFFQLEGGALRPLTRTRSISLTSSNSSLSPSWENSSSSVFGTLPRRGRRGSVRKHLLKFIPGLNHSVEEEECSWKLIYTSTDCWFDESFVRTLGSGRFIPFWTLLFSRCSRIHASRHSSLSCFKCW